MPTYSCVEHALELIAAESCNLDYEVTVYAGPGLDGEMYLQGLGPGRLAPSGYACWWYQLMPDGNGWTDGGYVCVTTMDVSLRACDNDYWANLAAKTGGKDESGELFDRMLDVTAELDTQVWPELPEGVKPF